MQPAKDPFQPLLNVIDRYRQDVHQLQPPTTQDNLAAAIGHLQTPIPPSLMRFLERWNGAILFRGALRIRSATEMASAAESVPGVIVFADGPGKDDRWAFAPSSPDGRQTVFGRWADDTFHPLHERFER